MATTLPPKSSEHHFSISNILSKFRPKRKSDKKKLQAQTQQQVPQDTRPPLIPAPLPLVLPEHQQTLPTLGWTTITFPDFSPLPGKPSQSSPAEYHPVPGPHP